MSPDQNLPFDAEAKPPIFEDAIASDDPNRNAFPAETTISGTEIAVDEGVDLGADEMPDPDERDDLEGPDVLEENDGTMTHPSFGAGVPLHLGMGTGAGSDEDEDAPRATSDQDII